MYFKTLRSLRRTLRPLRFIFPIQKFQMLNSYTIYYMTVRSCFQIPFSLLSVKIVPADLLTNELNRQKIAFVVLSARQSAAVGEDETITRSRAKIGNEKKRAFPNLKIYFLPIDFSSVL